MNSSRIAVCGAGFSGAVIARELATHGFKVDVFESRPHVAGNCHTERDAATGVMKHVYGPHIFHTSNDQVWEYVKRFGEFIPYTNRVKAISGGKVYSLPVNLLTINSFFGRTLSPSEARRFVEGIGDSSISEPRTFEEQALRFLGRDLYEAFFKGYTRKQWGMDPSELPASILKRLPVRFDYDDNYYASKYQGIPKEGYTSIVKRILDIDGVSVHLGSEFLRRDSDSYEHVFCSGPLDAWFGYEFGDLRYRTLDFQQEVHDGDYQGNAVINYCDEDIPFTRISEHKHFAPWESHDKTVIYKEFSRLRQRADTPYYPVRLVSDKSALTEYVRAAQHEQNVSFVGRLGTYRYLDMHVTIAEALDAAAKFIKSRGDRCKIPAFFVDPLS